MLKTSLAFLILIFGIHQAVANDLAVSAQEIHPVLLGSKVPAVKLSTLAGKSVMLAEQLAGKPAILVFYRGGWCPYCNLQLSDLRNIETEVKKIGYQIIAISPDRPEELAKTIEKQQLKYTLLSDSSADVIRAFGIAFKLDDETIKKYATYGIDLEKSSGHKHHALPVPAVFVVDGDGIIQFSYMNPDYTARVPGNVIVAAAKAIVERQQYLKLEK